MVKFLEEPDESSLSDEQIEKLCAIANDAARKYIASKVSNREISDLSISVDLEESQGLNVEVDVDLTLSQLYRDMDVKKLAEEAVKVAFEAIDKYMRKSECRSKP
jgi:Holliday junction resolvase